MKNRNLLAAGALLLGLLLAIGINHHWMFPDFRLVPGDRGDTRLVVFVLEHWYAVLQGHESFFRLAMFYPDPLALGYADGLFLFALPYVVFRALGADYFLSYQLLCIVLTMLGFLAWKAVLRRVLRLQWAFAILGAVLLASMNSLQVHAQIGKLLGFNLYPVLILLLHAFITSDSRSQLKARLNLGCFSVLLGLFLFTSYYPAWYFLFTMVLFAFVLTVAFVWRRGVRHALRAGLQYLRLNWVSGAIALAALVVGLIPFAYTYWPLVNSNAQRSFELALEFAPTVRDIVNVSAQNYVWGPVLSQLGSKFGNVEVQSGTPVLVLLLFCVAGIQLLLAAVRRPKSATTSDQFVLLLAFTGVLVAALSVKFHELSFWYLPYTLAPGASALRATGRYLMVFDIIVIVVAVHALDRQYGIWSARARSGAPTVQLAGFAVLGLALIAEQINGSAYRLDRLQEMDFLRRFQPPSLDCAAFYLDGFPNLEQPIGYYQLDAMMVAMKLGLPTVNGYSAVAPDGAFRLLPNSAEYKYRILRWLQQRGATSGICELDATTGRFRPVDAAPELVHALEDFQSELVAAVGELRAAARGLQTAEGNPGKFFPEYLEEHGLLDTRFGYGADTGFRWMQDRYWIGGRACPGGSCYAIGIVGSYLEIKPVLEAYGPEAVQTYFPLPEKYDPQRAYAADQTGELLLVFSPAGLSP